MGRSRPIAALLLGTMVAVAGCGGDVKEKASPDGRCVADYDPGKDYFPVKLTLKHATNFTLEYAGNYKVVTVEQPAPGAKPEKYVLVRCGTPAPELEGEFAGATTVETPVQAIYSASTTHLPFITDLGILDALKGVASAGMITSSQVRAKVDSGEITEYAKGQEIDTEKVIAARPDVLITGGTEDKGHGPLRQAGVKIVPNAEWLETSALGRAEWIKLFAALTETEAKAGQIFDKVEAGYRALVDRTKDAEPVTVLPGQMYQGQWSMPGGESYAAGLIKDAGGDYAWSGTKGTGTTMLDLEGVLSKAKDAEVWLAGDQSWKSLGDIRKSDPRYGEFAAFKSGRVWNSNKALGPGGGNDYWERGVARPDLVLGDLVAILHPDLAPGHEFAFYQQMTK